MKLYKLCICALTLADGCSNPIKDENAKVIVEKGTDFSSDLTDAPEVKGVLAKDGDEDSKVFWVGSFDPHEDIDMEDKAVYADEGLYWGRTNKISISIDKIIGDSIIGHSVVAGNNRPFHGKVRVLEGIQTFDVSEPGDDKYDGRFTFVIRDGVLEGEWEAFRAIDISKRMYKLEKQTYRYDPDIMLERSGRYGNWEKFIERRGDKDEYSEFEYASSTAKIYEINASNTVLEESDVENLVNSDLVVIRNTIYARHGYSFKNRPLRFFFDNQDWYIPVHADIKSAFTEIEKKNIQLLLRYEKNAKEYYDYFGRG